jgi:hypothetical protein
MDARGAALTLPMLRDMANLLLSAGKKSPLPLALIGPLNSSNDTEISLLGFHTNTTIGEPFQKTLELLNRGSICPKGRLKSGLSLQTTFSTLMSLGLPWVLAQHRRSLLQRNTMEKEHCCKPAIGSG